MGDSGIDVATYLPASLVHAVALATARAAPWCHEVDGTMVMSDLSGFTPLSERLGALGDEGAERLTNIINSFFERLLKISGRYGGDTLLFGGDAILLLFDGPSHASRAVTAALAMLKETSRVRAVEVPGGRIKLGMSVGAHSDTFLLAAAGLNEATQLFYLGEGAAVTARAESAAGRGQLAVSARTVGLLDGPAAVPSSGDFLRVDKYSAETRAWQPPEARTVVAGRLGQLESFLPPYLRMSRGAGPQGVRIGPEHRRVTMVFIDVLGLEESLKRDGLSGLLEQLQGYAAIANRLALKHHGYVVCSDIATQGTKLMLTFGAPMAHEYAATNAARFAVELNAELRDSGLSLQHKVGVNGGHVFAGEVGPAFRRQYTVMGDAVNLAARLMAAAPPGEVYASRLLLDQAGSGLCARELEPIAVKGKAEPVAVCVLEEERRAVASASALRPAAREGRMFGRRAELETIRTAWEGVTRGGGRTVLVQGEPGIGKTRLIDEALGGMADPGQITRAACFEHLQAAPFTPWVDVLSSILGLSHGDSTSERTEAVRSYVKVHLPEFLEVGSLLNPLLALSLPQGDVVNSLESGARRERLFELVSRILTEAAAGRGRLVFIEDIHWIDESSLDLVRFVTRRGTDAVTRVLLLLTTRPTDVPLALEGAAVSRIELTELTEAESLEMVREALQLEDLPREVAEAIYAKTKGNPLFLEEVVRSLQAPNVLNRILGASSVSRAAELAALEIPDRVQGLLMSRIDRLSPDTREVLKAGSVAGRSFDESVLAGIDDELLHSVSLGRAFDELIAAALIVPERDGDGLDVSFRHALVQDVAYESLPFARRRYLHGRLAHYLETTQAVPDHGLLLHHYRHAGDTGKTRMHAVRASESSVAVYANLEAIDYLAVALDTATSRTPRDACLRSRFEELMGDSLETLARYDEAVDCFSRARRRWASPAVRKIADSALRDVSPIDEADARDSLLCWKIAVAMERGCGAYTRALRWLEKGAATLPPSHLRLTARMEITRGGFLTRLGRFREAVEFGEEGLALAREDADPGLQAYALTLLGFAFDSLGRYERGVECHTEAIVLYEQAGDLHGLAMSHGNLAGSHMYLGEFRAALEHDELALALHGRVGSTGWVAIEHVNLGAVLIQMGDLEAALEHLDQALRLRSCQGVNPGLIGFALVLCCQAHVCAGELEAASREIAEGRQLLEDIGAHGQLLDAGVAEAELQLARGDLVQAAESSCLTLTQAQAAGAELNQVQALCMLGRVRLAEGDPQAAIAGLEAGAALAEKIGAGYERARTLAVLAEVRAACADGGQACEDALAQAIQLFRKMGARYDLEKALEVRERLALDLRAGGTVGGARR